MGNPHAVQVVDDVQAFPVLAQGPLIERHPRFPKRVNAGFMQIVDRAHIRLRVFERGAGETLACGTGACAAAIATSFWAGSLDTGSTWVVDVPGGRLTVRLLPDQGVELAGPAALVADGVIDLAQLSRRAQP